MLIKIVFMGSPEFSLPTLRELAKQYQVEGVVTQPDRPAGRGRILTPPPVKRLAESLHIPVIQPRRLREPEAMEQLRAWKPDLIVVAAFGQILKPEVLDMPRYGCVNVHASLLPLWRGAAPIQAAILQGDEETGITMMKMDPGIDTGAILCQRKTTILPDDTAGTLGPRLAEAGAGLLIEALPGYFDGSIRPKPQEESRATYAPMLKKEDGLLDVSQPGEALARKVRAYNPWPGAYLTWKDGILKIYQAHAVTMEGLSPGETTLFQGLPALAVVDGLLVLDQVQPAGKKVMPGNVFVRGARSW